VHSVASLITFLPHHVYKLLPPEFDRRTAQPVASS
jgi:hypothetical protein